MKICDLHTHSYYSDGTFSPEELIQIAEKKNVAAVALTDHNSTKGLPEFMRAGEDSKVVTIPGCEFTTEYRGTELHMVGLFFSEDKWPAVEAYLEPMRVAKKDSNHTLIDNLSDAGYNISYEEVAATTDADEFNRAHVARFLTAKGYVASIKEAFDELLYEGGKFYIPPKRLDVFETIKFINKCGGVSVLAHPFLNLSRGELEEFLPMAAEAGLVAMETRYSKYDEETTAAAMMLAEKNGIMESGGSDFHGDAKPGVNMGSGRGNLAVPFEIYEELKEYQCRK